MAMKLTASQRDLVEAHIPLVYWVCGKVRPPYQEKEDVIQCGFLGLVQATLSYDPTRGPLAPYAVPVVRSAMWGWLRIRAVPTLGDSLDNQEGAPEKNPYLAPLLETLDPQSLDILETLTFGAPQEAPRVLRWRYSLTENTLYEKYREIRGRLRASLEAA